MKRVSKVLTALVLGTVLAGLAAGCGGGEKKADTIKVGANLEMTGGSASYGISSKNAIELAFKEINEKGGINGKQLELVVADNKSEAAEATNAMQKLVSQDNVVAVIGPNLSSSVIAASAINNSAKVLDIAPMATNPYVTVDQASGKTKDFNYRTCFIDPFQGTVMAKFATAELGVGNAAVLIDNSSDYAKGLAQFFKENFVKEGGAVTAEESYLQKDTDFKATLTKIKATNPDFLYVPGYYQEVGLIVKQARELGKMPEIAGAAALNNTYFSSLYSPEDSSDINKNFVAAYEKAYGQKPDVFAALSYDSALLVAEAIKNAGSTEPAKISEAMAKINGFSGVSGSVTFDDKHNPVKSAVILEYKDGAQSLKTKINP